MLFLSAEFFNPRKVITPEKAKVGESESSEMAVSQVSRSAVALAWFVYNLDKNNQESFFIAATDGFPHSFLTELGYDEDAALSTLEHCSTKLPLLLQLSLQGKIRAGFKSVHLAIDVAEKEETALLVRDIDDASFRSIATAFFVQDGMNAIDDDDDRLPISFCSFKLFPPATLEKVRYDSTVAELSVIEIAGSFKQQYGFISRSSENHFRFLQKHAWGVKSEITTRVKYQTPLKGGHPLEFCRLGKEEEFAKDTLMKKYGWRTVGENMLQPPTSCFVIISAAGEVHDRIVAKFKSFIRSDLFGKLSENGNGNVIDLSSFVEVPSYLKPKGAKSEIREELERLGDDVLAKAKKLSLSDNYLISGGTDTSDLDFIADKCIQLEELDLSRNSFASKSFGEWLMKYMTEKNKNVKVNITMNAIVSDIESLIGDDFVGRNRLIWKLE